MKTSIFDMTLTLPPLVEMTEVEPANANNVSNWYSWDPMTYCG